MANKVRTQMVEGAARLLARQGLQGTSFSGVIELTGAPRGSLYHHFPEGKDQLVGAAIELAGLNLLEALNKKAGAPAEEITGHFLRIGRSLLTRSRCEAGCPVLAVTVATDSGELLDHVSAVFRQWRGRLAELLEQGGLPAAQAQPFAATLVAASEGAVVLGRADRSVEAYDMVAAFLLEQLRMMRSG